MVLRPKKEEDLAKRYIKPQENYRQFEEEKEPHFLEEPEEEYIEKEPKEKIIKLRQRETMPRAEDEEIKSLQRVSPIIIGNLFDRVRFLGARITELKAAVDERKKVNREIIAEVNEDIQTRKEFMRTLAELSDKRDFMLDISLLAREKRKENVQFWRDLLEITTELRELEERFEMESKIANIFSSIKS